MKGFPPFRLDTRQNLSGAGSVSARRSWRRRSCARSSILRGVRPA